MNYTDPQRRNNVEFAKNVKFVEPNETLVYACPVILPNQERVSLVLVAPKVLKVQKGDVLCSPQAGGIIHKIVKEISDGKCNDHKCLSEPLHSPPSHRSFEYLRWSGFKKALR